MKLQKTLDEKQKEINSLYKEYRDLLGLPKDWGSATPCPTRTEVFGTIDVYDEGYNTYHMTIVCDGDRIKIRNDDFDRGDFVPIDAVKAAIQLHEERTKKTS